MEQVKDNVAEESKMTEQEQIEYDKYKYKVEKLISGLLRGARTKSGSLLTQNETNEYQVYELLSYYADKGEQGRKLCELLMKLTDKYYTPVVFYHEGIQIEFPENIKDKINLLSQKLEETKQQEAIKESQKEEEMLDQLLVK